MKAPCIYRQYHYWHTKCYTTLDLSCSSPFWILGLGLSQKLEPLSHGLEADFGGKPPLTNPDMNKPVIPNLLKRSCKQLQHVPPPYTTTFRKTHQIPTISPSPAVAERHWLSGTSAQVAEKKLKRALPGQVAETSGRLRFDPPRNQGFIGFYRGNVHIIGTI